MTLLARYLSGIYGYVAVGLLSASIAAVAAYKVTAWSKDETIHSMQIADDRAAIGALDNSAKATADFIAVTARVSASLTASLDHTIFMTQTIIKEVPRYVTPEIDAAYPVPCGVIRMRDAAALQTDPARLESTACPSDGAKSPVAASALSTEDAGAIGAFYEVESDRQALRDWANGVLKVWAKYQLAAALAK